MYRRVGTMTLALAWFPVLAADARAELLFESNGVELHGTARLLLSGASTCNVLESDTSYESKQANHGAPMDVWRLDFEVLNRTGRWLDHLIAGYQIASEWPACTNWDRPEGLDVFVKVDWAGAIGTIQETGRNVVAPGARLMETRHFVVLRGDPPPRFSHWSLIFETGSAGPAASGPDPQAAEAALRLDRATRRQLQQGLQAAGFDPGGADGLFGPRTRAAIRGWQASQGVQPTGYLTAAQVEALRGPRASPLLASAGAPPPPPAASADLEGIFWQSIANGTNPEEFEAYLAQFPNGVFRALAEARLSALGGSAPGAAASAGPTCAGQPAGTACWMALADRPGCLVWDPYFQPGATVTWTTACVDGLAQGTGTLTWTVSDGIQTETGRLEDGRQTGHWIQRFASGNVGEGPYVNGVRNEHWVFRFADGGIDEGPMVGGERNGHWVSRYANGNVGEGPYVNDERNGHWVFRTPDGTVVEGPVVAGEEHGDWVLRRPDGRVEVQRWVNGERVDR